MLALKILAALTIAGVGLVGAALLRNGVPISAQPGRFKRIFTYLTTNVAETEDDHRFAELRTRQFKLDETALVARVEEAMVTLGWNIVPGGDPTTLRAEVRTPLFGFKDDLVATVEVAGNDASMLRVRSASRVGRGDLGANAGHILKLYAALDRASNTGARID